MNQSTVLELQLRLAALAIAIETSRYDDIQNAPIYLPEIFGGNESGEKRPMTKKELEVLIDSRWKSALKAAENRIDALESRAADLEAGYSRLSQQIS